MTINSDIFILGTGDLTNIAASGTIGTAVVTVDRYSSMRLPQSTANLDFTIPAPTIPFIGQQFELLNTGTVSFTVAGIAIGVGQAGLWTWNGTAWSRISPLQQLVGGNIIALSLAKPVLTVLTFDGINVRFSSLAAAPNFEIAVAAGTRNIRYISEHEYPGGSFSIGATFAAPLALTTTYQGIGDLAFVPNESAKILLLDESSGNHYQITAWFYAANLTSIIVERIGLSIAPPLPINLKKVVAAGIVRTGDTGGTTGARPITNGLNFASATATAGSAGATNLAIVFSTPLPTANYKIDGTLISNTAGSASQDNTVNWIVATQSSTGFTLNLREWSSVAQDVSLDIECTVRT